MTFYNIIFGILFLCAIREVLQAWFDGDRRRFWMSAVLTVLISNDILYTSHCIEERKLAYTISMKLADLVDFILLALAVLLLSPNGNLLGVQTNRRNDNSPLANREPHFWLLICAYWSLCMLWNFLGGAYTGDGFVWRRDIPYLFFLPLLAMLVCSRLAPGHRLTSSIRPLLTVFAALYLLAFKAPEMSRLEHPPASIGETARTAKAEEANSLQAARAAAVRQ